MTAALAVLARSPYEGGSFRYKDRLSDQGVGAIGVSPNQQWAAVATTGVSGIMAPLSRLQAWYWVFILLLAVSTVAAFSLLLGRVTESLKELTGAAKRIGGGDLQPWLPPPSNDEVGQLTVAFSDMLDRLRHMMAHVDHKGRLAVVGQLSSYLAHEIRNPLSSIKMNLQRLDRSVRAGHVPADCSDAVEISLKEVDRLASSVTSILQLGRSDQGPSEVVSLHEVIEEVAELLQGEMNRAQVELQVELDAAADRVVAVAGQMKGVFVNLIMNALEAQPQGGLVQIRSELRASTTGEPVVAVRVRDLGCGVPPSVRDRIFEPFFTTKGTGSGIGLAVVARTLNDHGGDIRLEDLPAGKSGAEFVVSLPLAAVGVDAQAAAASVDARRRRWRGTRSPDARDVPEAPRAPAAGLPASASEALTVWAKDRGQVH
jgi:signal transduction histidine kinase